MATKECLPVMKYTDGIQKKSHFKPISVSYVFRDSKNKTQKKKSSKKDS